jgi:hypothetical protein
MLAADVSRPDLAATKKLFNADLDSELFLNLVMKCPNSEPFTSDLKSSKKLNR